MEGWHDFFVAEAGASAALTGLIFVGISINLDRLIKYAGFMLSWGLCALAQLVSVLIVSTLLLGPGQSNTAIGLEVLATGVITWAFTSLLGVSILRHSESEHYRATAIGVAARQVTTLPLIIAGAVILTRGDGGLYWLLPAFIGAFISALSDAWVLLVEINR